MSQPTLPGIAKPFRPEVDSEMILEAAQAFMAEHNKDNSFGANAKGLVREYIHPMDGYEIAVELIRSHHEIDRDEMELLDEFSGMVDDLHKKAIVQWVIDNDIRPPLPIGTLVTCKSRHIPGQYHIDGIVIERAKYELKEVGQVDEECGNRRMIVDYEDVTEVQNG